MRRSAGLVALLLLAGCSDAADPTPPPAPDDRALDAALSEPVEDRVYPRVGDPGIDVLHYDLDLAWDPEDEALEGDETVTFRATKDASRVRLDLSKALEVDGVRLDGEGVDHDHRGKNLVVEADVVRDRRYTLEVEYAGSPRSVTAPTSRLDLRLLGWTTTEDGAAWTMQEPFGAHTWYAVNDHPSDEALYDFTLRVPEPMVGVANGELVSRTSEGGDTVTHWSMAEPAASYVVTVAFDELRMYEETSASGVPITLWYPEGEGTANLEWLRRAAVRAVDWSEEMLGPYPFDTLGFLFVESTSGMETQTMVTLGLTEYTTSLPVLVHEAVHQWWGNQVTPRDWRDLWINEGMATYLQAVWESEHSNRSLAATIRRWTRQGQRERRFHGPPGRYDRDAFAQNNVYVLPAVMWHQVRGRLGDEEFFRLTREFPAAHDNENVGADELIAWWQRESGEPLAGLFRQHLYAERQPGA